MKTKLTKLILSIFVITFAITGCSKDEDIISASASSQQDILTFATVDEFNETLQKVNAMKPEERIAWEKEHNFKSFGTISNEIYDNVDPLLFKSVLDVKAFVELNSAYIQFFEDSKGDSYCVPKELENAERFLMNTDKMYIIGNAVYKKFDEELISADIIFKESLQSAENIDDLIPAIKQSVLSKTNSMSKVTSAIVTSDEINGDITIGSDNYRLNIKMSSSNVDENMTAYTVHQLNLVNYARWLGIWWARTYNTDYDILFKATDTGYGLITPHIIDNRGIKSETLIYFHGILGGAPIFTNPHLVGYDIYAKNTEKGNLIDKAYTY